MTYSLDSPEAVETLTSFVAWMDEEYRGDVIGRPGQQLDGNRGRGRPPAFQAGLLGIMGNGFWVTGEIYNQVAPEDPVFTNWDVASYPIGPSGTATASGYWPNWAVVPTGAAHAPEAFGYIDYIGGPEGMEIWFSKIPDLPTNANVPTMLPPTLVEKVGEEKATSITDFFKAQLDVATPMWTSPVESFATDQIQRTIDQAYAHGGEPAELLAAAQRRARPNWTA